MISCVTSHHYVLASSVWFEAVLALLTVTFYLLVYFHAGGLAWGYLSHKLRPGFKQDALQLVLVAFDIFSSWLGHVRAEDKGRNRSRSWTSACMLYKWLHLLFFKSHDLLQLKFSSGFSIRRIIFVMGKAWSSRMTLAQTKFWFEVSQSWDLFGFWP